MEPLFVSDKDVGKMRSTIKQFVREWSAEVLPQTYQQGQAERDLTFRLIIDEFLLRFPQPKLPNGDRVSVLSPGTSVRGRT